MLIVDSQIHLWPGGPTPPHHRQSGFTPEQAIVEMTAAGVHAAINHPPGWDAESNAYAIQAAADHPDRFATLGWLKLDAPDALERVRTWRDQPGMIGLRFICMAPDEQSWPTDGVMDRFWPVAEEAGLPVAVCGPFLLPHVAAVAERHPDLKLTIDHLGFVGFTPERRMIQANGLLDWARFPNVAVKLTGLPDYSQGPYPFTDMHDAVKALYDAYGPDRLFWGSDITRLPCTWRQCVAAFTEDMPFLSQADLVSIMGEAFCAWHDWRPAPATDAGT